MAGVGAYSAFKVAFVSAIEVTVLTRLAPGYAPFTSFVANFTALFIIQAIARLAYYAAIYPFYRSPLRDLPGPKVDTLPWELSSYLADDSF